MKHPLVEAAIGALLGLALGAAMIYGLVRLADMIVEKAHEPYSHSISNSRASCWSDGEAIAVVPPDVAQVVRL